MTEVTTRIEAILSPLLEERDRLRAERQDLIRQREAKDRDLNAIEKVLRAAGYKQEKPRATRKNGANLHPVAPQRVEEIFEWCEANGPEFSKRDVAEALGISDTLVHNAFARMRAESPPRIRLLGKSQDPKNKGAHMYAVNRPKEAANG
jgi:hypothetical protein